MIKGIFLFVSGVAFAVTFLYMVTVEIEQYIDDIRRNTEEDDE